MVWEEKREEEKAGCFASAAAAAAQLARKDERRARSLCVAAARDARVAIGRPIGGHLLPLSLARSRTLA